MEVLREVAPQTAANITGRVMALLGKCSKSNLRVYLKNNTGDTERLKNVKPSLRLPGYPAFR